MDKGEVFRRVREVGIVPVVRAASADAAMEAVEAVSAAGIPVAEITMTVPDAVSVIERAARELGSTVLVGAGTVLDAETARACIDAGARFVVSPALDLETVATCREAGVAVFPGVLTPTEVVAAWRAGADAVKIFPCGAVGGASYLRALKAPLPQVEMMPTGGVSLATAADFIRAGAFAVGVGSDLVSGDRQKIAETARAYLDIVRDTRAELLAARAS